MCCLGFFFCCCFCCFVLFLLSRLWWCDIKGKLGQSVWAYKVNESSHMSVAIRLAEFPVVKLVLEEITQFSWVNNYYKNIVLCKQCIWKYQKCTNVISHLVIEIKASLVSDTVHWKNVISFASSLSSTSFQLLHNWNVGIQDFSAWLLYTKKLFYNPKRLSLLLSFQHTYSHTKSSSLLDNNFIRFLFIFGSYILQRSNYLKIF